MTAVFYILHAQQIEYNFDKSESERELITIGAVAPKITPPNIQSPN